MAQNILKLRGFKFVQMKGQAFFFQGEIITKNLLQNHWTNICLLYTSDAADDMQCVDLGGRRIIKKC